MLVWKIKQSSILPSTDANDNIGIFLANRFAQKQKLSSFQINFREGNIQVSVLFQKLTNQRIFTSIAKTILTKWRGNCCLEIMWTYHKYSETGQMVAFTLTIPGIMDQLATSSGPVGMSKVPKSARQSLHTSLYQWNNWEGKHQLVRIKTSQRCSSMEAINHFSFGKILDFWQHIVIHDCAMAYTMHLTSIAYLHFLLAFQVKPFESSLVKVNRPQRLSVMEGRTQYLHHARFPQR